MYFIFLILCAIIQTSKGEQNFSKKHTRTENQGGYTHEETACFHQIPDWTLPLVRSCGMIHQRIKWWAVNKRPTNAESVTALVGNCFFFVCPLSFIDMSENIIYDNKSSCSESTPQRLFSSFSHSHFFDASVVLMQSASKQKTEGLSSFRRGGA